MPEDPGFPAISAEGILTVSALNRMARQSLERQFPLLWVSGEISNLRRPGSGHLYFALKDESAQIDCVMFRGRAQLVPFRLQDGLRIEARALVTLYEARGGFQLNVEALRQAGIGVLYEAFVRLRALLEQEGLFASERKQLLPEYPRRIGIVTSLQAAALQDILTTLARRAVHLPVVIYPVPVQGEGAAEKIADVLRKAASRLECDVLIIARGGGSIEDLWSFNEEAVVRAIAACPIPVITGIGHETDTTLADLVADWRAPTPTAAAEAATGGFVQAQGRLGFLHSRIRGSMIRFVQSRSQHIDQLARRLTHPGERLKRLKAEAAHLSSRLFAALRQKIVLSDATLRRIELRIGMRRPDCRHIGRDLNGIEGRMRIASTALLSRYKHRLETLAGTLQHLSPQSVLQRGYALAHTLDGQIIRSASQLNPGTTIRLTFGEGGADATVTHTWKE